MVETTVERKLRVLLGHPDEGLEVGNAVRDRLLRQRQAVSAEQCGQLFEDTVLELGLG
jgi:hypothetical protein